MSSGRYTAYHVYQDLNFQEAQRAGTRPYTLPEYQCKHSQRGYLFQFENMVERTHFDAATTTCCDEPVMNFANKPQYSPASKPMNPRDCGGSVTVPGCTVLEVAMESSPALCADTGGKIRRIKILCPFLCHDLVSLQGGGSLKGRYGTFRSLGMEAGDVMILDYTPDAAIVDGWYDGCSGVGTLVEEFCGGYTLSFTLQAGLDFPGGCGCDCCGENGSFPPPSMTILAPESAAADWTNQALAAATVSGSPACSGGTLTGTFYGLGGSAGVSWNGPAQYHADSVRRFVTRDPAAVGSNGSPACCGGVVEWRGSDACGGSYSRTTTITGRPGTPGILPASGTTLIEHTGYTISGTEACSFGSSADLQIASSCIQNAPSALGRHGGYLTRSFGSGLLFSATEECSGCCGNGQVLVGFSNGCGEIRFASYPVRRPLYAGAHNLLVGRMFRCEGFDRDVPPLGHFHRIGRWDLMCDNTSGNFSHPFGGYYTTLAECLGAISGAASSQPAAAGGCGSLSGGAACCLYADNGVSGEEFRSRVLSVSGVCCSLETGNGAWINHASGARCCPV